MALNDVVYNKTVDVAQSMPVPVVFAKQNENGKRKVIVTLLKNGQPFLVGTDISGYIQGATAPNPATKQPVRFKRDLTLIDAEGNASTVTFVIAESMTAEIGITQCEIALYDSTKPNEILCTANINIEVQGTGMSPQDEMASDDYQAIVSIKAEVTAMRDEVRTKTAQAVTARAAAETAAQNAYNSALGVQKIVAGNEAYTKQEADLKYSVAPRKVQTSTTGELKLTDADDGLSYLELQGNSEQYTATGTNLFDVDQLVKTMQGLQPERITLMQDGDGKFMRITNNYWNNGRLYTFVNDITKSYEIGFKGRFVSGSPGHLMFAVKFKDGTIINTGRIGDEKDYKTVNTTIPIGKEVDYMYFTYGNSAGIYDVLLDGFYLYPTDAPSDEKPTGGYGTPSPEYPSEVRSVGDIPKDVNGVEIRNIIDIDGILARPESDWTVSVQGRTFSIPLDVSKQKIGGRLFEAISNPRFNLGLSLSSVSLSESSGFYLSAPSVPYKSFDFSASPGVVYLFIYITGSDQIDLAMVKEILDKERNKFVFTYASEADEYRPYIGENNGLVKLESQGVNHVDVNNVLTNMQTITTVNEDGSRIKLIQDSVNGTSRYVVYFNYKKNTQYSLYCKCWYEGETGQGASSIQIRDAGGASGPIQQTFAQNVKSDLFHTFNTGDNSNLSVWIYVQSIGGQPKRTMYVEDLMIVEGEKTLQEMKALKYQPYHHQITWIPLREPLRGIRGADTNFYADKVDKEGHVIQNIYCVEGRGMQYFSTDSSGINTSDNPYKWAYWAPETGLEAYDGTKSVLCNMLKRGNFNINQTVIANTSAIIFNLPNTLTGLANTETDRTAILVAIRTWVYANNPLVYYVLGKPIKYQIPAVYIETYDQETNVRCLNKVKPSSMGLDYKIAISSLIKRLEALESAAVNNGGK